jgi:protein-S-isoprenylcysteine O-methyltransferase Ste14
MSQTAIAPKLPQVSRRQGSTSTPVAVAGTRAQLTIQPIGRLDLVERLLVMGFYGWFFARFGTAFLENATWQGGLALISETVTVFFLLTRRPAATISARSADWLLALGATTLPLLVYPGQTALAPIWIGVTLQLAGVCCQLCSKLALGRSFGLVAAQRGLKRFGPYRLVRHPMYAGYMLCHLGFFCQGASAVNLCIFSLCWGMQILRVLSEEAHLSQDAGYREYREKVRYRLVPGVF